MAIPTSTEKTNLRPRGAHPCAGVKSTDQMLLQMEPMLVNSGRLKWPVGEETLRVDFRPLTCSGDMYKSVPRILPLPVSAMVIVASSALTAGPILASPKSRSLTPALVTKMPAVAS